MSYILWFTKAMGGNFRAMLFKTSRQSESGSSRHVIDPCLSSMPLVLCKLQQNMCSLILAKCTSLVCDVVCNTKQWAAETRVLILAKHKTSSMFAAVLATTVWFIRREAGNIKEYEGALQNHGTVTISLLSVFRICFNHISLLLMIFEMRTNGAILKRWHTISLITVVSVVHLTNLWMTTIDAAVL